MTRSLRAELDALAGELRQTASGRAAADAAGIDPVLGATAKARPASAASAPPESPEQVVEQVAAECLAAAAEQICGKVQAVSQRLCHARQAVSRNCDRAETVVAKHPVAATAAAFLLGLLAGRLLPSRSR